MFPSTRYRVGSFEADVAARRLTKEGLCLRLPEQAFQILIQLIARPGEVVTREELKAILWPSETHVDFDHGINVMINRLRSVFGDSASRPRYIETLPRRGYRLIAPVEPLGPSLVQAVAPRWRWSVAGGVVRSAVLQVMASLRRSRKAQESTVWGLRRN